MTRKIKVKLVLEPHEQGMSLNEISHTRNMSRHSTCQTVEAAKKKGLSVFQGCGGHDQYDAAYRLLFPERHAQEEVHEPSDMDYVHLKLGKTGVTLKLLHAEYCSFAGIYLIQAVLKLRGTGAGSHHHRCYCVRISNIKK